MGSDVTVKAQLANIAVISPFESALVSQVSETSAEC